MNFYLSLLSETTVKYTRLFHSISCGVSLTELIYQKDSYLKELVAEVVKVDESKIYLDRTIFHPKSGGVDNDVGKFIRESDGAEYSVISVYYDRVSGEVIHEVEEGHDLRAGDRVKCLIDWERRYRLMRLHTAAHILSAIMYRDYGALVTGGNVSPDKAYDDFSLEVMDKAVFENAVAKANEVVKRSLPVKVYWLPREEALKIPGVVKLASKMPPEVKELRIVEIPGIDIQADGGPHVRNTYEIGRIVLIKAVNKGRKRKRLYYTVEP